VPERFKKGPGPNIDTALPYFHEFSIDAGPDRRYSEPISKDLVTIANSTLQLPHPINVAFTSLYSAPRFLTTHLHMVTVPTVYLGGYFSA
jgi:hypothetical protein